MGLVLICVYTYLKNTHGQKHRWVQLIRPKYRILLYGGLRKYRLYPISGCQVLAGARVDVLVFGICRREMLLNMPYLEQGSMRAL